MNKKEYQSKIDKFCEIFELPKTYRITRNAIVTFKEKTYEKGGWQGIEVNQVPLSIIIKWYEKYIIIN